MTFTQSSSGGQRGWRGALEGREVEVKSEGCCTGVPRLCKACHVTQQRAGAAGGQVGCWQLEMADKWADGMPPLLSSPSTALSPQLIHRDAGPPSRRTGAFVCVMCGDGGPVCCGQMLD
jgi:hypothetical protein